MSSVSFFILFAFLLGPSVVPDQTVSLSGQITDESGAVIPAAKVTLNGPSGLIKAATTDNTGRYVFADLLPGEYVVQASAPKLMLREPVRITLTSGDQALNLQLRVALEEKVTVKESTTRVNTESSSNVSAMVIKGSDLSALADNPEDLQSDLQALAGPGAGPGGGSILVDGFSGGRLQTYEPFQRGWELCHKPRGLSWSPLCYSRVIVPARVCVQQSRESSDFQSIEQREQGRQHLYKAAHHSQNRE